MQTSNNEGKGGWYFKLLERVHDIIRKFELPEDIAAEVQNLTIEVAREQFKAGSRSGVAWILKKQEEDRAKAHGAPVAA